MIDNFVLIIGAMKCGTTSLFALLGQHPKIAPSNPKEPLFFGHDDRWAKGFDWYQTHWKWNPRIHHLAMEASTGYTKIPKFPNAAERIATVKADFRFIYLLRDPVDRVESHYAHQVYAGRVPPQAPGEVKIDPRWVAPSKYAMQISEYYKRFDANRIMLLSFDDLKSEPVSVFRRVCQFLQIDPSFEPSRPKAVHNPRRQFHPFYHAMMRSSFVARTVDRMPLGLKLVVRNTLGRKPKVEVKFSEAERASLWRELRDDTKRLREEYGFDTSRWSQPQD